MDWKAVGRQFAEFYYATFSQNRANLLNLYQADSLMTYEGSEFAGQQAIVEKLMSLPFQRVAHSLTRIDVQPGPADTVLIMVLGQLKADDDPPLGFCQTFQLKHQAGAFYCFNDIFQLTIHNH